MSDITSEQVTAFMEKLHDAGYAVVVWTPEEVDRSSVSVKHIEDCLISYGNEYFNMQEDEL